MLRAQAFEGLFTLVPILLVAVISILLRARAARRQKKQVKAAAAQETAETAPAAAAERKTDTSGSVRDLTATRKRGSRQGIGPQARTREPGGKPSRGRQFPRQRPSPAAYPGSTAPEAAPPPSFAPAPPSSAQPVSRESYVYPPPLALNEVKTPPPGEGRQRPKVIPRPIVVPRKREVGARDHREQVQARMKSERAAGMAAAARPLKRPSITSRLERLPPLKRAVIWAEILGPPGGHHHPDRL